jgi:hypothetical protein
METFPAVDVVKADTIDSALLRSEQEYFTLRDPASLTSIADNDTILFFADVVATFK